MEETSVTNFSKHCRRGNLLYYEPLKDLLHFSCFLGLGNSITIPFFQKGSGLQETLKVQGLVVQWEPLEVPCFLWEFGLTREKLFVVLM